MSEDCDCRTVDVRCVWVGYGHASESVGGFVARARDSPLFIVSSPMHGKSGVGEGGRAWCACV